MKKLALCIAALVCWASLLAAQAQSEDAKSPTRSTLCEVLQSPSKYDGKSFSFRAAVQSINVEDLLISDQSCASSGAVVMLVFDAQNDPERENLLNAIVEAMNHSKKGSVSLAYADLTVVFRTTLHGQKLPGKIFEIRGASNVKVVERLSP